MHGVGLVSLRLCAGTSVILQRKLGATMWDVGG